MNEETNVRKILDLRPFIHILIIRKSIGKLLEYVSSFPSKSMAAKSIINIKYELSKCNPDVLKLIKILALDPKRFNMTFSWVISFYQFKLTDTKHNVKFNIYNNMRNITSVMVNNERIFEPHDEYIIFLIVKALYYMNENENHALEEIKKIDTKEQILKLYKGE